MLGDVVRGGDGWVRDQAAHDIDYLGDRSYIFASVRKGDENGVCSQGTRNFLGGSPCYSDLLVLTHPVSPLSLWCPLGLAVPLTEGKRGFSFMLYLDLGIE